MDNHLTSIGLTEEDLVITERLFSAERDRINGVNYHTFKEFKTHVEEAIKRGAEDGYEGYY